MNVQLKQSVIGFKGLVDNICHDLQCLPQSPYTQQLKTSTANLREVFEKLAEPKKNVCLDHTFLSIGEAMKPLKRFADAVDEKKEIVPISVDILFAKWEDWQKQLIKDHLAASSLGNQIKPLTNVKIPWDGVRGQTANKQRLLEALLYPYIFTAAFPERTRGVLLYGLPGTGMNAYRNNNHC
jgi:hypothetical protein